MAGQQPLTVRLHARRGPAPWLRNWPATRRLVAVIAVGITGALAVGGLQVSSAVSAAAGYTRTTQLAVLGGQVTALVQALENERDLTAGFDAAAGQDVASTPAGSKPVVYTKAQLATYQVAIDRAYQSTDAISARVSAAAARIGGSFPAVTQSSARDLTGIVANIAGLRSAAVSQASAGTIETYEETIADLFAINDEFTSGSGDQILGDSGRVGSNSRSPRRSSPGASRCGRVRSGRRCSARR